MGRKPAPEKPALPSAAQPAQPPRDPRADTITTFAAQVQRSTRWKWLGPLLGLAVLGAAYAGWAWHSRQIAPAALQKRQAGLALLARDDTESLARATETLSEALAIDRRLFQAEADRSMTMILLAADVRADAGELEARFKALDAERIRIEQERLPGWEASHDDVVEKMRPVKSKLEPMQERARRLEDEALGALRTLARLHVDDVSVERALAMHFALEGNAEQCAKVLKNARAAGEQDPWLDLAEAVVDAGGALPVERRREPQSRLARLATSHPELLRARLFLAMTQAELEQKGAAVTTLDGLLASNPEHERARKLKAELLAPPPARPVAQPAGARAPATPPGSKNGGTLPRKSASSTAR